MSLREKQKDKLRRWIRIMMIFIAAVLLFFAVAVPFINNAVALRVENRLKKLPLPPDTRLVESISKAGKMVGNGNGMQYFGAILIKSDLPMEELTAYYQDYDCSLAGQPTAEIVATDGTLSFRHDSYDETYYIVHRWGSAPRGIQDLLNTDLRGH